MRHDDLCLGNKGLDWENPVEQGDIVLEYFKILDIMGIIYISYVCIYMKLYESGLQVGTIAESKGFHTHNIPNLMFQL